MILGTPSLPDDERDEVLQRLLAKLEASLDRLEEGELQASDRAALLEAARQVVADRGDASAKPRLEAFLATTKRCFGSTAEVITTAINLARLLAGTG